MQTQRRELKNKQHKLLVYLSDLYTQHTENGSDKKHQVGTEVATCQLCHEIKVMHEIIDEISGELKQTEAPQPRRRRRRKTAVPDSQLSVYCLSMQNGSNFFVRATDLTAAIDFLVPQQKNIMAYTTVAPTLYATISLNDQSGIKNIDQLVEKLPDFTGVITTRLFQKTPAMSY
ncbi:hypothetical protein [Loigolactobacillus zhaoyuanensis]|uniref:hypothetical protein n=1 Tax=Loigolactobacillus zhaoyuanensis TaxID=2486017 RepID=UPI000F739A7A|nr:hypothetical protein [Loigolactobacillus zhaoyuanensis]